MASIRKKLLAAVAMLLVACVMTVSSTYAWFTLSTAPEVKGITTTVGANGNLEIALGEYDTVWADMRKEPSSAVGDSGFLGENYNKAANVTWGNLVDLSDTSYGLGAIKLYPTRLNVNKNATGTLESKFSPLKYAIYGADGRITELSPNSMLGYYDSTSSGFFGGTTIVAPTADKGYNGVSAIGSASSMSPRQFATRNNRAAIESNRISARNAAQEAIYAYGGNLAGMAINGGGNITYGDVETLNLLVAKLDASADAMDAALKAALGVIIASSALGLDDVTWGLAANAVDGAATYTDAVNALKALTEFAGFTGNLDNILGQALPVADYEKVRTAVDNATTKLNITIPADKTATITPDENTAVTEAVGILLNKSGILIAGQTIDALTSTDQTTKEAAMKAVMAQISNLTITFNANSGVFSDIAEMTGKYNSSLTFPDNVSVEGVPIGGMTVNVSVVPNTSDATNKLGTLYNTLSAEAYNAPASSGGDNQALTDTYGYVVDLLFRTNATDSYLKLQVEGENRVYANNEANADLQGGGSNMSFTKSGQYGEDDIKRLAEGIRVVFYDTASGNILAVAIIDTTTGRTVGTEYKMDLKLVDATFDEDGKFSYTERTSDVDKIVDLSTNIVKRISALVYLDGDVIGNDDVSAVANVEGKLNLQFASSAELKPMVNNDLMGQ